VIRRWWDRWPRANVGIACGPSGLLVIDVDDPTAAREALAGYPELPETPTSSTAKGRHYYFRAPDPPPPNRVRVLAGVDVRSAGGYVIAPPSVHPSGTVYQWAEGRSPDDVAVAPCPDWLIALLRSGSRAGRVDPDTGPVDPTVDPTVDPAAIERGARNDTLTRIAGSLRRQGCDAGTIRAALRAINRERCRPPLADAEVDRIAASVARYAPAVHADPTDPDADPVPELPALAPEALYGLPGDVVAALDPVTEADPAAILATFLAGYGAVVGRGPHVTVEDTPHAANLYVALVGPTAAGRKGTAWHRVASLLREVDPTWYRTRVVSGLVSGEGLIYHVRDPREVADPKTGRTRTDPGVADKRLLVVEPELSSVFRKGAREGSSLLPVIREAWESGTLRSLAKNAPDTATGAHVSIIGHITPHEARRYLSDGEIAGGTANRFAWLLVRRSKLLPDGASLDPHLRADLIARIAAAVESARLIGPVTRDAAATDLWRDAYPRLSSPPPGRLGDLLARGPAQVVRLSLVYALSDGSDVIRREHLAAALAVWDYAVASVRYVFGDSFGDPIADRIMDYLRGRGEAGATRTDIYRFALGGHTPARVIARTLAALQASGHVTRRLDPSGGVRPTERWIAAYFAHCAYFGSGTNRDDAHRVRIECAFSSDGTLHDAHRMRAKCATQPREITQNTQNAQNAQDSDDTDSVRWG